METIIDKAKFTGLWKTYFNNAELPITFYYTDEEGHAVKPDSVPRCVIAALSEVRKGTSRCFDVNSIGCAGGKRYLGFADTIMHQKHLIEPYKHFALIHPINYLS